MSIEFIELTWREQRVRIEVQRVAPSRPRADAPLMVFLHEGLGSLAMWRDFPQRLCDAAGVHGLVYSRPGYGRSTPRAPDEHWGVDFMHRQAHEVLPALLDALHIDGTRRPLWLFGHSDGGSIALLHAARCAPLQQAARFAQQVAGVIVMAPHVSVEDKAVTSIRQARGNYLHTDLKQRLARYHDDVDSAFWGWNDIWLHPAFKQWNIEAEVAPIRCPLLALQGMDDEYGTLDQIHAIGRLVPHAELVELAQCGHSPQRDQPERVIEEVRRFVVAHAGSTQTQHQPTA
jgi:pimeloyl-ACP methyl ester carboxylesterase